MSSEVEILRAACCVAGLDGSVCDRERHYLGRLAGQAGAGTASLDAMIERAVGDRDFFQEQFAVLAADPDRAMTALFTVAIADGALHENERVILRHFADRLGVAPRRFEKLLRLAERNCD